MRLGQALFANIRHDRPLARKLQVPRHMRTLRSTHCDETFHRIRARVRFSRNDVLPTPFGDVTVVEKHGVDYVLALGRAPPPVAQSGIFGVSLYRPFFTATHPLARLATAALFQNPDCVNIHIPARLPRIFKIPCSVHCGGHALGLHEDSQITRKRGRHGLVAIGDHAVIYPVDEMPLECYAASIAAVELAGETCSAFQPHATAIEPRDTGSGGPIDSKVSLSALCAQMCQFVSGRSGGFVVHAACIALHQLTVHADTHPCDAVSAAIACSQLALSEASEADLAAAEPGPLLATLGYALHAVDLPSYLEDAADVARVHVYNAFEVPLALRRFQTED